MKIQSIWQVSFHSFTYCSISKLLRKCKTQKAIILIKPLKKSPFNVPVSFRETCGQRHSQAARCMGLPVRVQSAGFLLTVKTGPFLSKNSRRCPKISPNRITCLQELYTAPQKTVQTTGFLVYHAVCNSDVLNWKTNGHFFPICTIAMNPASLLSAK